jgi:hypothetical protein
MYELLHLLQVTNSSSFSEHRVNNARRGENLFNAIGRFRTCHWNLPLFFIAIELYFISLICHHRHFEPTKNSNAVKIYTYSLLSSRSLRWGRFLGVVGHIEKNGDLGTRSHRRRRIPRSSGGRGPRPSRHLHAGGYGPSRHCSDRRSSSVTDSPLISQPLPAGGRDAATSMSGPPPSR